MDRLISEQAVLEVIKVWKYGIDKENISALCEQIKAIPPAYKGMTNGEVIQTILQILVPIKKTDNVVILPINFWNSPYQGK